LLYRSLIEPFQSELRGINHLVVVSDEAMQNLPLSLLLVSAAEEPKQHSDFSRLDFLGRHFALSVVPSASSFTVLRSAARGGQAPQSFTGFGDPDLAGSGTPLSNRLAEGIVKEIDPVALRGSLVPLPETRGELETLGRSLKAPASDLYFRERATETRVKSADLSRYRIIAFATHGLLTGEFRGLAEPALVLTPPLEATSNDDGLLTASEIATLKLNADWVLLAACNTAAPAQRYGAEGLSGLAKAFIYAGSRALLVSHWWIASDATVLLTTSTIGALAKDPTIGRAEALRRAMLPLMNGDAGETFAHPVFWAPFINVGEGGAGR
jgi:CHAT domain-containing protein